MRARHYDTTMKSARHARSAVVNGKQDYLWVLSAGINYDNAMNSRRYERATEYSHWRGLSVRANTIHP
jgi:hypothetical protein